MICTCNRLGGFPCFAHPPKANLPPACVKCGGTAVRVSYLRPSSHIQGDRLNFAEECLQLTCSCGFSWERPCLDAPSSTLSPTDLAKSEKAMQSLADNYGEK